jgi:CBS domain containing-hemolysin-like protein
VSFTLLVWIFWASLFASLVFSTISYALRIFSRVRLEEALDKRHRPTALDAILSTRYDLALTASVLRLIANVTVILSVGWYFLLQFQDSPHPFKVFGLTIILTVPALLIFSVAIPQAWSKYGGEDLLALSWPLLRLAHFALWPAVRVLNIFDEIVRRLAGGSLDADDSETAVEAAGQEILSVVAEGTAEGAVDEDQQKMIEGVISFRDLQVGQIMTPRTEMIAADVHCPILELRDKILKDGLSRLPIYEGTLDNVVGILYAKDLLAFLGTTDGGTADTTKPPINLRTLMRPPIFVPRTKPLRDLLREFRNGQGHLAIVLDEYGGTSGLVTTEDILEEIVGDIADEYERPATDDLKRIDDRTVEVDARMPITDLNRALSLHLPEDADFQTLGGFVITTLGVIPAKGETLQHEGLSITILDAEPRRIKKLKLQLPDPDESVPTESSTAA